MAEVMHYFAYDQTRIIDDLVQLRYEASLRPGVAEAYSTMFQAPRQRWIDAQVDLRHRLAPPAYGGHSTPVMRAPYGRSRPSARRRPCGGSAVARAPRRAREGRTGRPQESPGRSAGLPRRSAVLCDVS